MVGLAPDEVHVWVVPVAVADRVGRWLDEAERAQARRFLAERARLLHVAAHGALRMLMGQYLETPPDALRFGRREDGKPYLEGNTAVRFNLSHSGELAAVAIACEREVGVDVEARRPVKSADGVARRIMTPAELARYDALASTERPDFLLWVWARKEALVKASGDGIRASMHTVSCEPTRDHRFAVFDLDVPDYAGAVAAEGHDWAPVVQTFTADT